MTIRHGLGKVAGPLQAAVCAILLMALNPALAQTRPEEGVQPAPAVTASELVIGTKESPPFAMKDSDGSWRGLSIELWARIARDLDLDYRLREEPLQELIEGTAAGRLDGAVSAISATADRERVIDFTQPYLMTGLGIATPSRTSLTGLWSLARSIFSLAFVQAVLGLAALLLLIGFFIWLVERRKNEEFGGGVARGLGSGFWYSAVTMTTVGYGDKAPKTVAGRFVAVAWMFTSVIIISGVTAGLTSALTTTTLQGVLNGPDDLSSVRVGSLSGASGADYLREQEIVSTGYDSVEAGLKALEDDEIDAFVHDRPLLQYLVDQNHTSQLKVLPAVFARQGYAVVLPNGSELREEIDRSLLDIVQSQWWHNTRQMYLGESEN